MRPIWLLDQKRIIDEKINGMAMNLNNCNKRLILAESNNTYKIVYFN